MNNLPAVRTLSSAYGFLWPVVAQIFCPFNFIKRGRYIRLALHFPICDTLEYAIAPFWVWKLRPQILTPMQRTRDLQYATSIEQVLRKDKKVRIKTN